MSHLTHYRLLCRRSANHLTGAKNLVFPTNHLAGISKPNLTTTKLHENKYPMGCGAQLAWKWLFTSTFFSRRFWPAK